MPININMDKARGIHADNLRIERDEKLAAADIAWMRAGEANDAAKQAQIAAFKQRLRDVPSDPAIAAATTPEQLRAVRPAVLDEAVP